MAVAAAHAAPVLGTVNHPIRPSDELSVAPTNSKPFHAKAIADANRNTLGFAFSYPNFHAITDPHIGPDTAAVHGAQPLAFRVAYPTPVGVSYTIPLGVTFPDVLTDAELALPDRCPEPSSVDLLPARHRR